jgi:N-acetylmuramoyl-L-alanine amidase
MKKPNRFFSLLATCYLLFFLISGCATVSVREPQKAYNIEGVKYFSLDDLCQLNNITWTWDSSADVATIIKGAHIAKFMPESNLVLLDNQPVSLDKAVILRDSLLLVPYSFKSQIVDRFFYEPKRACITASPILLSKRIVIDPGHGGKDPGAIARGGLQEKSLVLEIARGLRERLSQLGVQVVMTRSADIFVPLEGRAEIANKSRADLFISIHANANRRKSLSGIEVYYLSNSANDYMLAQQAARNSEIIIDNSRVDVKEAQLKTILWDMLYTDNRSQAVRLARLINNRLAACTGLESLGAKQANFAVLRSSLMPAVLVEVGFLSNKADANKLNNFNFKEQIVEGLVAAIVEFFQVQPPDYY